jgi:PEGA domain
METGMTAVSIVVLASGVLLATAHASSAQSQGGAAMPNAPAAMSVPHQQLAGASRTFVDLYQEPDRSDRVNEPDRHSRPHRPDSRPDHPHPRRTLVAVPVLVHSPWYAPGPVYATPAPYISAPYVEEVEERRAYAPGPVVEAARGWLRLETQPVDGQVYVDGYYVGSVEDFGFRGRPLEIAAGTHHVEVRAGGYETLSFEVRIAANQTVRYRGDLRSLSPAPPPSQRIAAVAKTFYVIPNCYAGDRPPSGDLPSGCDVSRLQVRK